MKTKRNYLLVFLILIALAGFLYWFLQSNVFRQQKSTPEIRQPTSQINNASQTTNAGGIQSTATNSQSSPSQANTASASFEERKQAAIQDVLGKNKTVAFFGRVIDQNDQPISDVRVMIQVRHWHYNPPADLDSDFPKHDLKTDADGKFELTGVTGDVLELESIEKDGYRADLTPIAGHIISRVLPLV
jgi:preprotein translocase subunit YajC